MTPAKPLQPIHDRSTSILEVLT